MKKMLITILIFIIILTCSFLELFFVKKTFTDFKTTTINLENSINQNNWPVASNILQNLKLNFTGVNKFLQLFLNRENIDKIQKHLSLLQTNINLNSKNKALNNIVKLKTIYEKINDYEQFSFFNIF